MPDRPVPVLAWFLVFLAILGVAGLWWAWPRMGQDDQALLALFAGLAMVAPVVAVLVARHFASGHRAGVKRQGPVRLWMARRKALKLHREALRTSEPATAGLRVRKPSETREIPFEEVFSPLPLHVVRPAGEFGTLEEDPIPIQPKGLFSDGRRLIWLESGPGSGKSTLIRWLLRDALTGRKGVVFPVPAKEWDEWWKTRGAKPPGKEPAEKRDPAQQWIAFMRYQCLPRALKAANDTAASAFEGLIRGRSHQRTFLLDGIDEILDPEARHQFWECWEAFRAEYGNNKLVAVLSFRKEGRPRDHSETPYALVTIPPLDEKSLPALARAWANALKLPEADRFVGAVRSRPFFTTPMWVRIAALTWDPKEEGLPYRPGQLYLWYSRALLRREHDQNVPSRQPEEVERELDMLGRVAARALEGTASLRIDCEVAQEALRADAKAFGWTDSQVEEQVQIWRHHGGMIDFHPQQSPRGNRPGRAESFAFQAQDFDFLLAFDAARAVATLLLEGSCAGLRWPAVLGDQYRDASQDFLPDRVFELLWKEPVEKRESVFRGLATIAYTPVQRLVVGHLLEQVLALAGDEPPGGQNWEGQVRTLLARAFPLGHGERLDALKHTPEGARVRAAESLALLGDPRQELLDPTKMEFVPIRAGICTLKRTGESKELKAFEMARFPVTVAQYRRFLAEGSGGIEDPWKWALQAIDTAPVAGVGYPEAAAYCRWLTGTIGREIRLPDEFEWEWAATGAGGGRVYPWGGDAPDASHANFLMRVDRVTPVGCYPTGASIHPAGALEELAGNVWEWTSSAWDRTKESQPDALRVVRGGSFLSAPEFLRCGFRLRYHPDSRVWLNGFRVVVSPRS